MIRVCGIGLDPEDMDVKVGSNLIAYTDTVSEQIKKRKYHGNPKYNILINKAIKILVKEQECWPYECCVMEMHLTFGHMCNHQFICYLSRNKSKSQYVEAGMFFKELNCRFLVDHGR